jgi:hypothetical protein
MATVLKMKPTVKPSIASVSGSRSDRPEKALSMGGFRADVEAEVLGLCGECFEGHFAERVRKVEPRVAEQLLSDGVALRTLLGALHTLNDFAKHAVDVVEATAHRLCFEAEQF